MRVTVHVNLQSVVHFVVRVVLSQRAVNVGFVCHDHGTYLHSLFNEWNHIGLACRFDVLQHYFAVTLDNAQYYLLGVDHRTVSIAQNFLGVLNKKAQSLAVTGLLITDGLCRAVAGGLVNLCSLKDTAFLLKE